ncbi:MAG: tetratricopeptide repeat protein [Pseudomonadales bacterium]
MSNLRNLLLLLLVSLLFAGVPVFASETSSLLDEAQAEWEAGDIESAFERYLEVLEVDPGNLDALNAASALAQDLGMPEVTLEFLIEAVEVAANHSDVSRVIAINNEIAALNRQMPAWVNEQLNQAAAVAPEDEPVLEDWQALSSEAQQALNAGDFEQALGAQESALMVADEILGSEHWATIAAARDLGYVYRNAGMVEEAEAYYELALSTAESVLGQGHPQTLEIGDLLAELYMAAGLFEQALALYETNAMAYERALGPQHSFTVDANLALVRGLERTEQYDAALTTAQDLCGDIVRGYGSLHPAHIRCLETLASVQVVTGRLQDAELTYDEIIRLMARSVSGVNNQVLGNLAQLGEVYRMQGRYQDSRDLLSGVVQVALESGHTDASYTARSYLGRVFNNQGEFAAARQVTEEVLDYGLANWQDRPLDIYNTLLEVGGIYQSLGLLADAEVTFEDAYAGLTELVGPNHPSTLVATNNLGQVYESIGLYDEAEPVLKFALEQFERIFGPAHPDTMRARNNLAVLFESQGNFREAEPLYQRSLDLMREVHGEDYNDTIAVKNNLAFLYLLMEDFESSAAMFEEVVLAWETVLGMDHQNTFKAKNNLARAYQNLGRLDEAETRYLSAYEARSRVLGDRHLDVIRSMIDLGGLYLEQERMDDAVRLATDALARAEEVLGEQHPYTFDALNLLARVRRETGELRAAVELKEEGLRRRTVFLDRMLWSTGQNAREGYIRLHRPEFDEYLAMLVELDDATSGRRAIDASLQRKGLLLKVTSEIQQIASLASEPGLRKIAEDLAATRKKLAAMTLSGPTVETGERHAEILYELESEVNELQGQLGRASVRFRTSIAEVSVDSLVTVMEDDSALVDFLYYEDQGKPRVLAGVAVKRDGEVTFELVEYADRHQVEAAVIDYRSIIQDDLADDFEITESGQHAYDTIWAPIVEVVDEIDYLYLIPDGVLNILPFSALVDVDEKYLIQTRDLHILTSARDLLPNEYALAQGEYVILAGPDYDSDDVVPEAEIREAMGRRSSALQLGIRGAGSGLRGLTFAPLPGAEEEGRLITRQVEKRNEPSVVYFGQDAQEEVLGLLRNPPEILHMATHGFFLEADEGLRKRLLKLQRGADVHVPPPGDNPLLRSGLAFAGVNTNAAFLGDIDTANDGVLTALEVLDLDLSGTQLVVLSACETGLGEIHEGEGVYGLRRSFQEAGVAEVISSLWEVSDAGTQALMTDFYASLLEGMPAREALRQAQLAMIDSPRWGYPYIWSAFMIVGSYESSGFTVQ